MFSRREATCARCEKPVVGDRVGIQFRRFGRIRTFHPECFNPRTTRYRRMTYTSAPVPLYFADP
jgi:hypothetical protein